MTTKNTQKYVFIENKLYELSKILCNEILKYKERILKEYSIFDIAVYKNLSNLFQDNDQHINYELIEHFYKDFYNYYFGTFKSHPIIEEIFPKIVDIMKYQWKHGNDTPMEPDECIEISKGELDREFREFFELMFNTIFHYSSVFNYIVENYNNIKELQSLKFRDKEEYNHYLLTLSSVYNLKPNLQDEMRFYKKASRKILAKVFIFNNASLEDLYTNQKHIFYISGIKLKQFQYKLTSGIIMRNPQINEIKIDGKSWAADDYDKESCVVEHLYKYKDFDKVIHNPHIIPLTIKLAFKNCAQIKRINNYFDYGEWGISSRYTETRDYYGNIPVIVPDKLILELPKLINLCTDYTNNAEKDFDNLRFLSIALDFYSQALNKIHPTHKIAYACLVLEALYNTTSEKVIHQIMERCSTLLSLILNQAQSKIKKVIRKTYEIRCAYVHAQNPLCSYDENLVEQILDIARYSIIIFLQLYHIKYFKNKIIKLKSNLNFKLLINNYYFNNFELMPNLKNEFFSHLPNSSWINNLAIECDYCRYRKMMINEFEYSNYLKWTNF